LRWAAALDSIALRPTVAPRSLDGGVPCASIAISTTSPAFSITRKRRSSFPSETQVRRGERVVHGGVELIEKLGRNDLCPCGSGRRFQTLLYEIRTLRRHQSRLLLLETESSPYGGAAAPATRRRMHSPQLRRPPADCHDSIAYGDRMIYRSPICACGHQSSRRRKGCIRPRLFTRHVR